MDIHHDEYGRAYTTDEFVATKYRIEDRQINYHAMKNWYTPPIKYVNFYTKDTQEKCYWLPPACAKGHRRGVIINTPWILTPYAYQQEAVDFVKKIYDKWNKSCMIISWTATGKSHILQGVIYAIKHRTVIVVPNVLIAKGIIEKLWKTLNIAFLTAEKYRKRKEDYDVLVILWASFNKVFDDINGSYDTIICDEWHHLSSKRKDQINKWKWDFICLLTATPDRKEYWEEGFKMYVWEIHNTHMQALDVTVYTHEYKYNYSGAEVIAAQEWLSPESPEIYRRLYTANEARVKELELILKIIVKTMWFKKIIVFVDRISQIDLIQSIMPFAIRLTWAENKDEFLESIKWKDSYLIVAMSQCAWEWFDLPVLECGILFMSTSWTNTIDQTAGRIRRYSWNKEMAYYIDFIDILQIMWWKTKKLWWYERNKIYKQKWWTVKPLDSLLSF